MVESLVNMMLAMWTNRCKCVHGHTKEEQQVRRKEVLMQSCKDVLGNTTRYQQHIMGYLEELR